MIKGNFDIKKTPMLEKSEMEKLEDIVVNSKMAGSMMIFRSKNKDDEELFVEDI
jgi:hypothetical protein